MVAGPMEQQHVLVLTHSLYPRLAAVCPRSKSYLPASSEVLNARTPTLERKIKIGIVQRAITMCHEKVINNIGINK